MTQNNWYYLIIDSQTYANCSGAFNVYNSIKDNGGKMNCRLNILSTAKCWFV